MLGQVASGMWQVARAELQQDLDSGLASDGSAQCSAVSLADRNDAPGPAVRLGIAGLSDGRTQW